MVSACVYKNVLKIQNSRMIKPDKDLERLEI